MADLVEQWDIQPDDSHSVEGRYRKEQWYFQNQRGDSLQVTPDDVVRLLDFLAFRLLFITPGQVLLHGDGRDPDFQTAVRDFDFTAEQDAWADSRKHPNAHRPEDGYR